ncbi:MAG: hypothetical protein AAB373_01285 [Patescibacteria group bacterium]
MNKKVLAIVGAVVLLGAVVALSLNGGGLLQGKLGGNEQIAISLSSTPVSQTLITGTKNVTVAAWTLTPKSDVKLNDLAFTFGGTAKPDTSISGVTLKIDGQVMGLKGSKSSVAFQGLNYSMVAGKKVEVSLWVDVSSANIVSGSTFAYALRDLRAEDVNGNHLPRQAGPKGPTMTLNNAGTLTISTDSNPPKEDIIVTGSKDVPVALFKATSTNEAFVIKKLAIKEVKGGASDNNVSKLTLSYNDSQGVEKKHTGFLTNGVAYFSGLNIAVPKDNSAKFLVSVDANTESATLGETIQFQLDTGSFEAVAQTSGETFKEFKKQGTVQGNVFHVYSVKPTISLNPNSPSGSRTVSTKDAGFIFDLSAGATHGFTVKDLAIDIISDNDFAVGSNAYVSLKSGSTIVAGPSTIKVINGSNAKVEFTDDVEFSKNETKTLTLEYDSAALLDEDAGMDDPVTFKIDLGNASTPGDVTWGDDHFIFSPYVNVTWFGNVANFVLNSNTLKY